MRRVASIVLLVVAGFAFPVLVLANWAGSTLYDSDTFSERAVEPLNSQAVRTELARRLTAQLVEAGNQQATSFRPAFELALEGVIDTDTFKSIFRNAVRRTHESIIEQGEGGGRRGLDLGASFALITSSLQASGGGGGNQQGTSGLDNSLSDVTSKIDDSGCGTPRASSARSRPGPSSSDWRRPSAASPSPRTDGGRCAASASRR